MIEILLQGLPKTPNQLKTMHWAARAKHSKQWRSAARWMAFKSQPKQPLRQVRLTFIRGSSRQCDYDNGIASVKPLIDGLVDAGIIADDNPSIVKAVLFGWEKAPQKAGFMKIIIEPLE